MRMNSKNKWLGLVREFILKAHDIALLTTSLAVLILFFFMCWFADLKDLWPPVPWGEYAGNHGPWRGHWLEFLGAYDAPLYIINKTLWRIFELQLIAILLAGGTLLFRRELKQAFLLGLHLVYLCVLFYYYYWLID